MEYLANFLSKNRREDLEVASILIKEELAYVNLKSPLCINRPLGILVRNIYRNVAIRAKAVKNIPNALTEIIVGSLNWAALWRTGICAFIMIGFQIPTL
jgi:hypothetical protein